MRILGVTPFAFSLAAALLWGSQASVVLAQHDHGDDEHGDHDH